jgi:tRNA threonylcarbamoyladenosine biosynthesis protein TsaB
LLILGIDTADSRGSVVLRRDGLELASLVHDANEDYSSWVLPAAERVCRQANCRVGDVDVFAVSTGPGSFTGLRVGLTSVKAWAEVYGKPIIGIGRLEAMASCAAGDSENVAAFYDARRGHIYGGIYRREGGKALEPGVVINPQDFVERVLEIAGPAPVGWISLDPSLITDLEAWKARTSGGDLMSVSPLNLAGAIAALAEVRARRGEFITALSLDANYVRRSDAEMMWKDRTLDGQ